jgi:hypothetical protein
MRDGRDDTVEALAAVKQGDIHMQQRRLWIVMPILCELKYK